MSITKDVKVNDYVRITKVYGSDKGKGIKCGDIFKVTATHFNTTFTVDVNGDPHMLTTDQIEVVPAPLHAAPNKSLSSKTCECGTWSTYGKECPDSWHSNWCLIYKENGNGRF